MIRCVFFSLKDESQQDDESLNEPLVAFTILRCARGTVSLLVTKV